MITSGNNILSWNDQSKNRYVAETKTGASPKLIPDALNGKPVLRFNGRDNGMETTAFQTFPEKRGTIIIVARTNGISATSGAGFNNFISTYYGKGKTWQFGATTNNYSFYDGIEGTLIPGEDHKPGRWGISTIVRDDDAKIKFYRSGRFQNSFTIADNQPDINTIKIGFNDSAEVMNGDIAEIIIYGRSLSPSELSVIHKYLSGKYNIDLLPPPFWERWWFYVFILSLLFFTVIIITKNISQKKLRKQLQELENLRELDKERQRISREMHDDIGAGLTQISLMSESARKKLPAENNKELEEIAFTSRKIINSMSEIIWSLNPENKTLGILFSYMREQLNKQLEYSGKDFLILFPDVASGIILNNEQRRNIMLITKEIVNNSIKHSNAKNISIKINVDDNELSCEIKDDGNGFDVNKAYHGNGLKNIRHRVEEIGGWLEIFSNEKEGSSFLYKIPLS